MYKGEKKRVIRGCTGVTNEEEKSVFDHLTVCEDVYDGVSGVGDAA